MSEQAKHTPGPWEWSKCGAGIVFDSEGAIYPPDAEKTGGYQYSGPIAVVSTGGDAGGEANGLLIAAAPDLLAALEAVHNGFVDGSILWAKKRRSEGDPYHPANTLMNIAFEKVRGDAT